jgi:ParB family chromosome partitioning protein
MEETTNMVPQAMHPRTNPLFGSNGGEMMAAMVRQVPLGCIQPDPDQPRRCIPTEGTAWDDLVASVRQHGVLQPILVRKHPDQAGSYVIICGERRWRAACEVGASHITARIINAPAMLAKRAHYQLMENALRQELSPLDEMEACVRLVQEECLTQLEIGKLLGVGRSVVGGREGFDSFPSITSISGTPRRSAVARRAVTTVSTLESRVTPLPA